MGLFGRKKTSKLYAKLRSDDEFTFFCAMLLELAYGLAQMRQALCDEDYCEYMAYIADIVGVYIPTRESVTKSELIHIVEAAKYFASLADIGAKLRFHRNGLTYIRQFAQMQVPSQWDDTTTEALRRLVLACQDAYHLNPGNNMPQSAYRARQPLVNFPVLLQVASENNISTMLSFPNLNSVMRLTLPAKAEILGKNVSQLMGGISVCPLRERARFKTEFVIPERSIVMMP